MNLNDNRLIIKTLKSGDQKVFSLVYASYYKPLCLFCSSYVSLEEAEEIVQDLMMYVWEKRELLVEDLSLKSFLFTSVRNRALNSITRSHITRQVYEEYQSQQLKSLPALDSCYGTELFNAYMEALHSLPKELQRVYVMSRYKQLTHKEIADKLEVSVQTVNYRIGKALQFFRIRLKDFFFLFLLQSPEGNIRIPTGAPVLPMYLACQWAIPDRWLGKWYFLHHIVHLYNGW